MNERNEIMGWFYYRPDELANVGIRIGRRMENPNWSIYVGNHEWVGFYVWEAIDVIENLLMWGEA